MIFDSFLWFSSVASPSICQICSGHLLLLRSSSFSPRIPWPRIPYVPPLITQRPPQRPFSPLYGLRTRQHLAMVHSSTGIHTRCLLSSSGAQQRLIKPLSQANGVNLGGWLEKEKTHDPIWWNQYAPNATDEWTFCKTLGSRCGPVLEARYASFLNHSTIDELASVGVNTLRIPTTYAAWVKVPGSQLYSGDQQAYLQDITDYAITKYNMHVIVGKSMRNGLFGDDASVLSLISTL